MFYRLESIHVLSHSCLLYLKEIDRGKFIYIIWVRNCDNSTFNRKYLYFFVHQQLYLMKTTYFYILISP